MNKHVFILYVPSLCILSVIYKQKTKIIKVLYANEKEPGLK